MEKYGIVRDDENQMVALLVWGTIVCRCYRPDMDK